MTLCSSANDERARRRVSAGHLVALAGILLFCPYNGALAFPLQSPSLDGIMMPGDDRDAAEDLIWTKYQEYESFVARRDLGAALKTAQSILRVSREAFGERHRRTTDARLLVADARREGAMTEEQLQRRDELWQLWKTAAIHLQAGNVAKGQPIAKEVVDGVRLFLWHEQRTLLDRVDASRDHGSPHAGL